MKCTTPHGHRYSEEIKQFAMTLHYYSPKAYDFVRKLLTLPHPSSIRAWAASVDCNPGYLIDVMKCLGSEVEKKPWMSDVALIVDAMALHKGIIWDPKTKQYVGTVDYGTALPEVTESFATEALVFMVSGLSGHFKHPIAYVLQDKCSATVQAQLIKDCIGLLHEQGLNVLAVVFDGCYTNQSTAKLLGYKMNVSNLKTWFSLPQSPKSKIHVIFDVCHLLKLMRNLLGDYKVICHEDKNGYLHPIKWQYIEHLNNLQEDLGLSFANKLKKKHILWTKHKMKVHLAAQTLSGSVAQAIEFLRDEAAIDEFQGSEATTEFIKQMNAIFELLNSKNPHGQGTKAPVSLDNLQKWIDTCQDIGNYIFGLKDEKGNYLQTGRSKTAVWGFKFSIDSI